MIIISEPALIKSRCAFVISIGLVSINSPVHNEVVNLFPLFSSAVERPPSSFVIND